MAVTGCFKKSWVKEKGKELNFRNGEPRVLEPGKEPGNSHFRSSLLAGHRSPPHCTSTSPYLECSAFMMEFFFLLFFNLP